MSVWLCRCTNSDLERISLRDQNIYTIWEDIKVPVNTFDSADSVEHYAEHELDLDYDYACDLADGMWAFSSEMQIGDLVILHPLHGDYFHLGIIAGGYCFDDSNSVPFQHMRKVNFFLTHQSFERFKDYKDILASFECPEYISRFGAAEHLMHMAFSALLCPEQAPKLANNPQEQLNSDTKTQNKDNSKNQDPLVAFEPSANASILHELQTLIHTDDGLPLAQLMSSVLKVKGFNEVTIGKVLGHTSLIAIAKADSVLSVRILNNTKPTNALEVEQFARSIDSCDAKFGILISACGYEEGLEKSFTIDGRIIKLWTCEDFLPELLKCYNKLCPQSKDLVPLKQIWVYDQACA